jgi:hypothetical protein
MPPKFWTREDTYGCVICVSVVVVVLLVIGLTMGLLLPWTGGCSVAGNNCENSGSTTTVIVLPYVTPPVASAAPTVFVVSISTQSNPSKFATLSKRFRAQSTGLNPQTVIDRFFNPTGGPSNLFGILKDVDGRVRGINGRLGNEFAACMASTPKAYNLTTWGLNTTFYAQCSETWSGPQGQTTTTGFDEWAIKGPNFYLFEGGGETHVAAILYNFNKTGGPDLVRVWYSVGCINRNGSHGVVEILARPKEGVFEMTAAGGGLGFCGAQIKSNNATMNITGSEDMGTCGEIETVCVSAADISQTANCTGDVNVFQLRPLGRMNYSITGVGCTHPPCDNGPSKYPGDVKGNVYLTGTGLDDTFFGPAHPFGDSVDDHRPRPTLVAPSSTAPDGTGPGLSGGGTGTGFGAHNQLQGDNAVHMNKLRAAWHTANDKEAQARFPQ